MTQFINFHKLCGKDDYFNSFILQCNDLIQLIHSNKKFTKKEVIFINNILKTITHKYHIINDSEKKYSLIKMTKSELKLYFHFNIENISIISFNYIDCLISLDNHLTYLLQNYRMR